jgi:hypothetical protein
VGMRLPLYASIRREGVLGRGLIRTEARCVQRPNKKTQRIEKMRRAHIPSVAMSLVLLRALFVFFSVPFTPIHAFWS